jgi:hypothetical protein
MKVQNAHFTIRSLYLGMDGVGLGRELFRPGEHLRKEGKRCRIVRREEAANLTGMSQRVTLGAFCGFGFLIQRFVLLSLSRS